MNSNNIFDEKRISSNFFERDVLAVAPDLLGKLLVKQLADNSIEKYIITEVEAYKGIDDLACHASKGRTSRTEIMYGKGGYAYIYLIYGMHWMLNVVTGSISNPQAVLIRGLKNCYGPGRVTRLLEIDKSYYGENFPTSSRIWFEHSNYIPKIETGPRIGVNYAGDYWSKIPWRFFSNSFIEM
jgi:DNA-3-methyladenine glycosylase